MKWSKYNYFFNIESTFLLYNSLSNSFAELEEQVYIDLIQKKDKENTNIEDTDLLKDLINMKVIVENEKDEINEIKYLAQLKRFGNKKINLTINPTLHCNFACPYCFEDNRLPIYMTDEVEDKIIDLIKKQQKLNNPTELRVTWFGGEPLMAFNRIVSLTKKLKELKIKHYGAGMITNGYLLTKNIAKELKSLDIRRMQITIDGLPETHNHRRFLKSGRPTFDKIVKNIDVLKEIDPDIKLTIRMNIDDKNKNEFIDVFNLFHQKKLPNTFVVPGFVHDMDDDSLNACLLDRKKRVEFLLEMRDKYNLNLLDFYPDSNRYECGIRNPNSFVIGPRGEIYKCWNDVGNNEKIVDSLIDNKLRNKKLMLRYLSGADPLEDEKCKSCFHLPICGGGCPDLRLKNEYEGKRFDTCFYVKDHLEEFLKIHYKNKMQ